ncbi:hypothetical protein PTI98_006902 [Pleurotus ostreatus]|nr:hypothetical protein PTI98_006902 [Pleurotus ostreatus]
MAQNHSCAICYSLTYVFEIKSTKKFSSQLSRIPIEEKEKISKINVKDAETTDFPPLPASKYSIKNMVTACAKKMEPLAVQEAGCAVCGQLVLKAELSRLKAVKNLLYVLEAPGVSRMQRQQASDPIRSIPGAVIDHSISMVSRGLWLGTVPPQLKELRFVEKLVIARVRYSSCFIRVSSGFRKMIANALAFESPVPKIYTRLPISKAELDEVLVILFTGPKRPENDDMKRTPFLVRANKVRAALDWLILNHSDYSQVAIDDENLAQYRDDIAPVTIQYKPTISAKLSGNTSS